MKDLLDLHIAFLQTAGVETDSRRELTDKLFFALKGENFDGNDFAETALAKGARLVVTSRRSLAKKKGVKVVKDPLKTLQGLARFHRRYLGIPIVAITGSNGKTTTKELVASVLSQKYTVAFTAGNLNNHIGVPLTLLRMDKQTQMGIVEMGANHQREIANLCQIAEPDYGYITNFGKAHLEGFGGFQGVIKGKSELYDDLRSREKLIFINQDDPLQVKQSHEGRCYSFGTHKKADTQVQLLSLNPFARVQVEGMEIRSHLMGDYNAKNITAAVGIGVYFGVPWSEIKAAIEAYVPANNRSQILERGGYKIILDAYNANPTSMSLSIANFERFPASHRIAILGDMFEVGATALLEHQHIVEQLETSAIDQALLCGETFYKTKPQSDKIRCFRTYKELASAWHQVELKTESVLLIKGSRGMQMERVLDML